MITENSLTEENGPRSWPPWQTLQIPNSSDQIVLVSPDYGPRNGPFRNLMRRTNAGDVVWLAELPEAPRPRRHNSFVQIRWDGRYLGANTWAGIYVLIDPATGTVVPESEQYTK